MKHLADEVIQKYLDGDADINKSEIDQHFSSCQACRQNVQQYRQLYVGLADETGFMLSANFSDSIVSQLQKSKEKSYNFFETALLIVAGLFSSGLFFYFTNLDAVVLSILEKNVQQMTPLFENVGAILGGNLTILAFAFLILILFGFADKLLLHAKHH
jgi:hypothetical protein